MAIFSKQDIYRALNTNKSTFDKVALDLLLKKIGWTLTQWRAHGKRLFSIDIIKKIKAFIQSEEIKEIFSI